MKNTFVARDWLRRIRSDLKMTTTEVSVMAKITQGYYSQIENGQHSVPVHTAKKIAAALSFDWQRFYEDKTDEIA